MGVAIAFGALCCLSGLATLASERQRDDAPEGDAAPEPEAPDEPAAEAVRQTFRDACTPGRRRSDPPQCPAWQGFVSGVVVRRSSSGHRRAEVRTLIPSRGAGDETARVICTETMLAMHAVAPGPQEGTVRVLAADGRTIVAHNNLGQCTTGLW